MANNSYESQTNRTRKEKRVDEPPPKKRVRMSSEEELKGNNDDKVYINQITKFEFPNIVSDDEWMKSRLQLLEKEKAFGKERKKLAKERQKMPVRLVKEDYIFEDSQDGKKVKLSELFDKDNNNLIVQHFMFEEEWEKACPNCCFWLDNINSSLPHLKQRAIYVGIAKANHKKLKEFKKLKGWDFRVLSSKLNILYCFCYSILSTFSTKNANFQFSDNKEQYI